MASKTLLRKLDIIITGEQTNCLIKYRTWSYKKMRKKRQTLVKVESFKMHH